MTMRTVVKWNVKKLPRKFATFIESTLTCEYYTLGDFPGLIIFNKNAGILKYIDNAIHEDNAIHGDNEAKLVTSIISLWLRCLPEQIKINGINLT